MLPTRCPSTLTMEARRAAEGLLGVSHLCTKKEIAKAYRKKALLAHPDKGGSEAHFTALTDVVTQSAGAQFVLGGQMQVQQRWHSNFAVPVHLNAF